jgi:hypothetical protein
MDEDARPDIDPAKAFEDVRRQLCMVHSAVEGLTAMRKKAPDYSTTLAEIQQGLGAIGDRLAHIEASRALALSPVELAKEITAAAETARAQDRQMLGEARDALARSLGRIDGMIERGQAAGRQTQRERWIAVGGMLAGILLWSILPGAIVRSLPESWHAPEWMAARMMGLERAVAGQRMIDAADKADGQ